MIIPTKSLSFITGRAPIFFIHNPIHGLLDGGPGMDGLAMAALGLKNITDLHLIFPHFWWYDFIDYTKGARPSTAGIHDLDEITLEFEQGEYQGVIILLAIEMMLA